MKKFFKEFKAFISKGNVFDLAVGMIIATAFNKIVSSLVNDIIMPLITWATGAQSLADLSLPLRYGIVDGEKVVTLSWAYGSFIQYIIDFLIIAFSVFIMVKVVNTSRKKLQEFNEFVTTQSKKEVRAKKKELKKLAKEQNRPFKVVWKEYEAEQARLAEEAKKAAEEKAKQEAEEKARLNPTSEKLLAEIRDLLKEQKESTKPTKSAK